MKDLVSDTLKAIAQRSKINLLAVQRYFRIKFNLRIDEDVLRRRIRWLQKQ